MWILFAILENDWYINENDMSFSKYIIGFFVLYENYLKF